MKKALCLLLLALLPAAAFAQEDHPAPPPGADRPHEHDRDHDGDHDGEMRGDWRHHRGGISISFIPKYYHLQDKLSDVFGRNGFNSPSQERFGFEFLVDLISSRGWMIGVGTEQLSITQDVGANEATYNDQIVGLHLAKNLTPDCDFDVTVGTLLGMAQAELEVLSPTANGRHTETSFLLEPTLGFAYRITSFVKLGAVVQYVLPVGQGTDDKGQVLGVDKISAQGVSAGVQLIIGFFGSDRHPLDNGEAH